MTGLNSMPADSTDPDDAEVVADGWFPPVTLARVRTLCQLNGEIVTDRLISAMEGAMLTAFRPLAAWRTARVLAGAASLAATTDQTLNGKNHAEVLWERAVAHLANADLAGGDRSISATDSGLARASEKDNTADEARREGWAAITDLLSIGAKEAVDRNMVSLL